MSVTITVTDKGVDPPDSHCSGCDMRFSLMWMNNPVYKKPEYCPFCGDEIERVISDDAEDGQ